MNIIEKTKQLGDYLLIESIVPDMFYGYDTKNTNYVIIEITKDCSKHIQAMIDASGHFHMLNIVNYAVTDDTHYIVYAFQPLLFVKQWLLNCYFSESFLLKMLYQIGTAIEHMNAYDLYMPTITMDSILVTKESAVKLIGLSKVFYSKKIYSQVPLLTQFGYKFINDNAKKYPNVVALLSNTEKKQINSIDLFLKDIEAIQNSTRSQLDRPTLISMIPSSPNLETAWQADDNHPFLLQAITRDDDILIVIAENKKVHRYSFITLISVLKTIVQLSDSVTLRSHILQLNNILAKEHDYLPVNVSFIHIIPSKNRAVFSSLGHHSLTHVNYQKQLIEKIFTPQVALGETRLNNVLVANIECTSKNLFIISDVNIMHSQNVFLQNYTSIELVNSRFREMYDALFSFSCRLLLE